MESRVVYIGEEIAAAGYRLAGLATRVPGAGKETAALLEELGRGALILLSASVAGRIAAPVLRHALAATRPLVLVVPGGAESPAGLDVAARVRLQLGVSAP